LHVSHHAGSARGASTDTSAAAGGGALYAIGIFGALFYYWRQADASGNTCGRSSPRRSSAPRTWCTRDSEPRGHERGRPV